MTTRDKNIAFIIPSIEYGGAELQVINQINYLVNNNSNVFLIVIDQIKSLRNDIKLPANRIYELNFPVHGSYGQAIVRAPALAGKLGTLLVQNRVDIVLANLPFTHYVARLVKVRFSLSKFEFKLINYHHSLQYLESPLDTWFKKSFNKFNSMLARLWDDKNIFISKAAQDNVSKELYVKNPVIIFNSVPFKTADVQLAFNYLKSNQVGPADFLVVVPGRLQKAKGHTFFIQVLDKFIKEAGLNANQIKVIFAGGGALENEIGDLINSRHLQAFIHITGFVPNDLLLSLLTISNLVVIPSLFEGFGNVALEALMVNKLILASDAGGLKEIIKNGDNGFQFRTLDEADCLDKFNYLYQNRNKELISKEKLAADFELRFSFEAHMRKLIQEINSCVE